MLKFVEIRDSGTCIPAIALQRDGFNEEAETWMFGQCGYGPETILLVKVDTGEGHIDGYEWPNKRTMTNAHIWIEDHWNEIESGAVVDVRFILGETDKPATPDRFYRVDLNPV